MSAASQNTTTINFSDNIMGDQTSFDYSENALYNLSMPLFSILLTLERLPKPDNLSIFKSLLTQHIVELSEQGKKLQYPSAVIDKLCCLHCIVLDEFIIHSSWGVSSGWENNTLLSELFNLQSGGDLFFTITEKAMRQPEKMRDLLSIAYVFLQIGFKGRFRSRQSEKIGMIIKQVSKVITDKEHTPKVTTKENGVNKALILSSGRRYFSFSLIIMVLLALIVTFFDYWYEETYPARSREFRELNNIIASYSDNNRANYRNEGKQISENTKTEHLEKEVKNESYVIEQEQYAPRYRVQLNSFSSQANAEGFINKIAAGKFDLSVKGLGKYFIVYSLANTLADAEQQKKYYRDTFQLSTIVFELDNTSNTAL